MKTWLQSRRFFVQTLAITLGVLLTLCIFFIAFLYHNSRTSTEQTIFQIEADRNAELLRKANIYFNLAKIGKTI